MNPSGCWFHRHPTSSFRKRQILSDTGSCGSICFNNVQYRPGWNLPTRSDCLINLDGHTHFEDDVRICPAIQTHSGSAPRIHAHLSCLLLDALLSLQGPNRSLTQTWNEISNMLVHFLRYPWYPNSTSTLNIARYCQCRSEIIFQKPILKVLAVKF